MPKSSDQKLKLLYIIKILSEQTDEEHMMSMKVLIDELEKYGITAERKSIYSDISLLVKFGYNIVYTKVKRGGGYFLAEREFELPELKLLVDAVQSSKFITVKKSRELIEKLERLAGQYDAGQLQRQVYVAGRIKAENESIYYNIDHIHRAIQEDIQISFQYLDWTLEKKLKPRKEGVKYRISPWALTWQDENYYLIAYDKYADKIKHYRVDKMGGIELLPDEPREGISSFKRFDIGAYTNKTFGMFSGEEVTVALQMPDRMLGVVIDRFGKEVDLKKTRKSNFSVRVKVAVSEQFFGWVTGLGTEVKLLSPKSVVVRYEEYLKKIIEQYER
ncbi:WYL domain-containing protein [Kineothrix sedimenti]|uniref:WYL domain-containing protein n=1 Tax=Kineothrix sedimenti TaxID=3123317 RepID=A0ABZ3ERC0_9FIRM